MEIFLLLIAVHFTCDFALQSDYIARGKNRYSGVAPREWWIILSAHGFIHGLGVYLLTESFTAFVFQVVTHIAIDFTKCEEKITYKVDQLLHVLVMAFIAIGVTF